MNLNRRDVLAAAVSLAGGAVIGRLTPSTAVLASVAPAQLAADPRRPQYHLLPAANWMNDPNAPIFWQGEYHMFYQYNPNGAYWGDMHWGHAVSPDMVHWRHLPTALAPTPGGPDAAGCFSGTGLADGDRVAVLYTGVVSAPEDQATIRDGVHSFRESQCLAFGTGKNLTTWTKDPQPVIATPPAGLGVTGFRDPAPWKQGDTWYMAVGSGIRGQGGAILLYRSEDLRHWEYLHLLARGTATGGHAANPVDSGEMWECPDFFPLGEKHVLIHSTQGKACWQTGTFDTTALVFQAERGGVLDFGSFYAPKTQLDSAGHRILWGWIPETRPEAEYRAAGWAGLMSLPRVLSLDENHDLRVEVAPEVETLRQSEQKLRISGNGQSDRAQLARMQIHDGCGEIACSFRKGKEPVEISLTAEGADGKPWLTCRYDPADSASISVEGARLPLGHQRVETVELRFYIDGSVIECFAGGHGAYTKRFYYPGATAPAIHLRYNGNFEDLAAAAMWQMTPISRDRLTT